MVEERLTVRWGAPPECRGCWIRRHIRQCFWLRWHSVRGRCRALRRLGVPERMLRYVPTRRGEWFVAAQRIAYGPVETQFAALWIRDAVGDHGKQVSRRVQPRDTENRTSGGVGGCRGTIPVTRPDRFLRRKVARCAPRADWEALLTRPGFSVTKTPRSRFRGCHGVSR